MVGDRIGEKEVPLGYLSIFSNASKELQISRFASKEGERGNKRSRERLRYGE